MVDMCRDPEGIEGLDEESVEKWSKLRKDFIEKTRNPGWKAPEQFHLSLEYFDDLPGHGPLLLQPLLQPSSTGPSRPDIKVVITVDTSTNL